MKVVKVSERPFDDVPSFIVMEKSIPESASSCSRRLVLDLTHPAI